MTRPARLWRIKGESRRFYTDPDTLDLDGQLVTTRCPDVLNGYRHSPDSPHAPCRLTDGSPCYVKPTNLIPQ